MPLQAFPPTGSGMNAGAVFTSSSTWTVPSGVTYAMVVVRGGDGTYAAAPGVVTSLNGTNNADGVAGGSSSVLGITGSGGAAGQRTYRTGSATVFQSYSSSNTSLPGCTAYALVSTTPGSVQNVTVGAGVGAFVSIMWRA